MGLLTFSILLFFVITAFIKKLIRVAPLKYNDEERFIEAIRYEEKFSHIFYNDPDVHSER